METSPSESLIALPVDPAEGFAGDHPDQVKSCKILIIDDEAPNVRLLERVLIHHGFENFVSTTDSSEAAALFLDFEPDLVLTDWLMPGLDGFAVIQQLRALTATDDYLPIVVLTADISSQTKRRALAVGATDFLTKPFDQVEVLLRIRNLLGARLSHLVIQTHNATLEESVRRRTIELEQALTDLRRSQKKVIQQERLAALGTMAGGIAHDFNNDLAIIMGFGELLLREAAHGLTKEAAAEPITMILGAAEDAAKTVRRLGEFYREDEPVDAFVPLDLNELIARTIANTQPRWQTEAAATGRAITVIAEPGEVPWVSGDATELRRAFTNLIFNAVDALPHGGRITLRTARADGMVLVSIGDNGTGMSEEVRQHCLEPFFTTKGEKGTGLGLATVFGIIQRHGGTIDIESALGRGTTFLIRLPADGATAAPATDALPCSHRPWRVLVVDDQPILSRFVCEYLREELHLVETALSGIEACEKFRAEPFDLVITDQIEGEMSAEQLAVSIKALAPAIPVVLLTAYTGELAPGKQYSEAIDLVLAKPLSRAALRHGLAKAMAAA